LDRDSGRSLALDTPETPCGDWLSSGPAALLLRQLRRVSRLC